MLAAAPAVLGGCSPSWEIGGTYFPAWLLCMVGGLLATLVVRWLLIRLGVDPWVRPRPLAYPAIAVFFTILLYLLFFTR